MRAKAVSKVINMDKKNGRKLSNVLKDVQDEKGTETGEEKNWSGSYCYWITLQDVIDTMENHVSDEECQ